MKRSDPVAVFFVEGVFPSKENQRRRRKGSKGYAAQVAANNRVKQFQQEVGKSCMAMTSLRSRRRLRGQTVAVHIWMHRQRIDLDNCKLIIDGMKGHLYPDDRSKYVKKVIQEDVTDLVPQQEKPGIWLMVRPWGKEAR